VGAFIALTGRKSDAEALYRVKISFRNFAGYSNVIMLQPNHHVVYVKYW
jgi:hypothetical protein